MGDVFKGGLQVGCFVYNPSEVERKHGCKGYEEREKM